jgi:uncharacterized protein (TIGR00290 family)
MEKVIVSWSGGKDSAAALGAALRDPSVEVVSLLTTVAERSGRVAIQNVRRELIVRQAEALRLPLRVVEMPEGASNIVYEERLTAALKPFAAAGVGAVVFGDIFLADVRAYREALLARSGLRALFPLWGRETRSLAGEFISAGHGAVVTAARADALDASFAGAAFDHEFLARLPAGVDPCGERGEFHTFVHDAPRFDSPIPFRLGGLTTADGHHSRDLLPE